MRQRETSHGTAPGSRTTTCLRGAVAVVLCVAVVLRVLAARGDLWLDEIWSLNLATSARSPLGIFTHLHLDNNHYLNSLYLRLMGASAPAFLLRLPALVAGILTVPLAMRLVTSRRADEPPISPMAPALLFGFSYPLIQYSGEARGYALVVLLALTSLALMRRVLEAPSLAGGLAVAAVASAGFLAHFSYVYVYVPLLGWSLVRGARRALVSPHPEGRRRVLIALLACHLPPMAVLLTLWRLDIRYWHIGGGPPLSLLNGGRDALVYTLGAPHLGPGSIAIAVGVAVVLLLEVCRMLRKDLQREPVARTDEWIFFLGVLSAPLVVLQTTGTGFAPTRYFLAAVPFVLLLLGRFGSRALSRGPAMRAVVLCFVLFFLAGNGIRIARFLTTGRGTYHETVAYLAAHSDAPEIRVAGDHDFRNETVLEYYARRLPAGRSLRYVHRDEARRNPPEWYLRHSLEDGDRPASTVTGPGSTPYVLVRQFHKYGLSGWNWYLYRRSRAGAARGRGP